MAFKSSYFKQLLKATSAPALALAAGTAFAEPDDNLILANADNDGIVSLNTGLPEVKSLKDAFDENNPDGEAFKAAIAVPFDISRKLEKGDVDAFNAWIAENNPDGDSQFYFENYLALDARLLPDGTTLDFTNITIESLIIYGDSDNAITILGGSYEGIRPEVSNVTFSGIAASSIDFHEGQSNIQVLNSDIGNMAIMTGDDGDTLAYLSIQNSQIGFADFARGSFTGLEFNDNEIENLDLGRTSINGGSMANTIITDRAWFYDTQITNTDLSGFSGPNLILRHSDIDAASLQTSDSFRSEYETDNTPVVTGEVIIEPNLNQSPTDFVVDLLEQNQGVFLGDTHNKLHFPLWVAESMDELRNARVDTLYFEMVQFKDNKILEDFNARIEGADQVLLDYLLEKWPHSPGSAEAKFEIALAARENGIRVKGIDIYHDEIKDEFFLEHAEVAQRNKDWARHIEEYEAEEPSRRYVVFGGQLHGDGLAESYGFDTMLGIPEIGIADEDGNAQIIKWDDPRSDYKVVLPPTGFEGFGIPGDNFSYYQIQIDKSIEFYGEKALENSSFQPSVSALERLKAGFENNSGQQVQEAIGLLSHAMSELPEDTHRWSLVRLERANSMANYGLTKISNKPDYNMQPQ